MIEDTQHPIIGHVMRASTVGFICGTRSEEIRHPTFGAFVRTRHGQNADIDVIGLIHAISIDDDPMVRQMVLANNFNSTTVNDQRVNRMVPVEINVVNIGYVHTDRAYHTLPPRPPLSLDPVQLCDAETILRFTQQLDFLRLVLNITGDVPIEQLIAAALQYAADARPPEERYEFLVNAGRRLASLLAHDLPRLQHLLRLIKPA